MPNTAPRILMLQVYTKDILSYARIAFDVNSDYCVRNGYDYQFVCVDDLRKEGIHPAWGKITETIRFLKAETPYTHLFVLDADAMVVNPQVKLESFIAANPNAALIISENGKNGGRLLNTGSFIVKKTGVAKLIFEAVLSFGLPTTKRTERFWEQCILNDLYEKQEGLRKNTAVLSMRDLNCWWKDEAKDCTFVWHLMARDTVHRINAMSHWYMDDFLPSKLGYDKLNTPLLRFGKTVVVPANPPPLPPDGGPHGKTVLINVIGQLLEAEKQRQANKAHV